MCILDKKINMIRDMKIYAAPLQGFTEAAWRNAHEGVFGGVDAYYTPFVRLEKGEIRNKDRKEVSCERNRVAHLVPQVIASTSEELAVLVDFLMAQGYREMDLNMGCPFPPVVNRKMGSGLLPYPERVEALLEALRAYPDGMFSVKMRLGWQEPEEWRAVLPLLNGSVVKQITLHPRIGKQQYKGTVDLESFALFYEACEVPLVYNGDLYSVEEMQQVMTRFPRLSGLMIGRGLLANPSLAAAFRDGKPWQQEVLYRKVAEMHDLLLAAYEQTMEGGEAQLLHKMKTMWEYLLPDMDKKARKQLLKCSRLDAYLRAVREALF